MEKTSLEKSHSKWSNFKLTIVCLFLTISVSAIWSAIVFIKYIPFNIAVIILGVATVVLFFNIFLLVKFKR